MFFLVAGQGIIGKIVMATHNFKCDIALEISCLMVSVSDILALYSFSIYHLLLH